jgi:hypothetical protein
MAGITLDRAREHLEAWLDAELAVSTGQSYQIGTRRLQRANLSEIRQQIAYWQRKIYELDGNNRNKRVVRIVPRDL